MKTSRIFLAVAASLVAIMCITFLFSCGKEDAKVSNLSDANHASTRSIAALTYSYEYVENHLVVYKHVNGTITEYFLVQRDQAPLNTIFQDISNVAITEANTKITIYHGNQSNTAFSTLVNPTNALPCAGIVNHKDEGGFSKAVVKDNILSYGKGPAGGGVGGGLVRGCKECLDGGCGSTSCSRSIEVLGIKKSCSTTCGTGYHACCGDLTTAGCFCRKDICCE